ncbi:sigma-54 dependent transcriptional regulator [Larkinella harenae]
MARLIIVDDEKSIRDALRDILEYEGYEVDEAKDGEEGLDLIKQNSYDVALCDIKMPKMDGLELLLKAAEMGRGTQFIMISAYGNVENAVEATKRGAFDFITKPPDLNRLLVTVRNAIEKAKLVTETKTLKRRIYKLNEIVGDSDAIRRVKETIDRVARTEARVLITGANGSGKEMVAKQIHEKGSRAVMPLIEVNCAAIPSELIESELFGHEKGAFTGAAARRQGKFEQADGGTLFLDEIGDMSLSAQAKVLRALQENKITRVGGDKEIKINVRVIAATNKDLRKEIADGNFREDLYHRLSVIRIHVPPLADRQEDVPLLAEKFLHDIAEEYGAPPKEITTDAMEYLQSLPWTGNVRELRNVIERLVILCGDQINRYDVETYA